MKIIFSIGLGRIHLVQSAAYLSKHDLDVELILGWVPKRANSWLVRCCSWIIGRDLSKGMEKRMVEAPALTLYSCPLPEFFANSLFLIARFLHIPLGRCAVVGWTFWGWCSRKYISNGDIFHVRSGAGQGGAIVKARKRGLKVLVDHSMAHPGYIEKHLKPIYDQYQTPLYLGISNPFFQLVLKNCEMGDIVLVNSDFVKNTFLEMGFDEKKIRIVTQGVRLDFYGLRKACFQSSRGFRLLFTGRFGFHKGGAYILEAIKLLRKFNIVFEMDVVGSYETAKELIGHYERDELPIKFHGPMPQDDLKLFLANADIYVFPSLAEGCASSGMEAMAAGLCVIATHQSGLPITEGETGFIVPAQNAQAIAERIIWLAEHPSEIDRVGANAARLIATEYTWEKYAEKVEAVYRELLTRTEYGEC